ncbi:phosphotriesterase family protein [Paenibacillus nasutitermitis]|uniref:Aryldialkylphosphatase n=1 Tax=Paenibacillus nasutitermitis TaxID=1652958 RepID=A0A917E2E8_9BACL|nr:TatD family hydrolase [Paenibacillus nasutitermitis]GGD93971.1 aryldialkylphosphatase [Paenibacillus nasutitermitis]
MLQTVTHSIDEQAAGRILVHEHIMVGFVEDGKLSAADYDNEEVVSAILPLLLALKASGCSTFVDCAPLYLGRDPYILKQLSVQSGLHIITNTGLYKCPYLPDFAYEASERELSAMWIREARDGIGDSGVYPGFIKIALNDGTTINDTQQKILRAAMRTSLETGLPIQCHTIGGDIALHANEIMRREHFERSRFIWVHAQTGTDLNVHRQLAEAGMWISIDSILPGTYEKHAGMLRQLIEHGAGERILLSQDTGWYTVGEERGGVLNPYHRLFTDFIPYAVEQGLDAQWLERCVTRHPFEAMSRRG